MSAEHPATFELAGVGTAQADPATGRLLRVNPKLCEITGYPKEELLGMTFTQITHPEDRQKNFEGFQQTVRGEILLSDGTREASFERTAGTS